MVKRTLAMHVWASYFGKSTPEARDAFGVKIAKGNYGDLSSPYGWEIDHIRPKSEGGTDKLSNLRLINIRNNRVQGRGK